MYSTILAYLSRLLLHADAARGEPHRHSAAIPSAFRVILPELEPKAYITKGPSLYIFQSLRLPVNR